MSANNFFLPATNFLLKIVFFLKLWTVFLGQWVIYGWKLTIEFFDNFRPLVIIYLLVFIQVLAVIGSPRVDQLAPQPQNQRTPDLITSYFQTEAVSLKTNSTLMKKGQESEMILHPTPPPLDLAESPLFLNTIDSEFQQIHLTATIQKNGYSYPMGRELLTEQALFYFNQGKFDLAAKFLEAAKNVDPGWWGWK